MKETILLTFSKTNFNRIYFHLDPYNMDSPLRKLEPRQAAPNLKILRKALDDATTKNSLLKRGRGFQVQVTLSRDLARFLVQVLMDLVNDNVYWFWSFVLADKRFLLKEAQRIESLLNEVPTHG